MKILVLGAGSLWVYLWAKMHDAGHHIVMCGRRKIAKLWDTIKINDDIYGLPERTVELTRWNTYDIVFITCKIYDLIPILETLVHYEINTKKKVFIQNGILPEELTHKIQSYGDFHSISVFEGFRLVENILITNETNIWRKIDNSEDGKIISQKLLESGINCTTTSDIWRIRAEKTIMNCSVNALSAIHRKTLQEMYKNSDITNYIREIFYEAHKVLSYSYSLTWVDSLRKQWYNQTKYLTHYLTTYQDVISWHPTEIPYLNGLIVELGKQQWIPTPYNTKILTEFAEIDTSSS